MFKFEFGVAECYHMASAKVEHMGKQRFLDYDSAQEYVRTVNDCFPTIYLIVNDEYCFYCKRSAVKNLPCWVYSIESTPWGQIETRIWWNDFIKNPNKFFHLAVGKIF